MNIMSIPCEKHGVDIDSKYDKKNQDFLILNI